MDDDRESAGPRRDDRDVDPASTVDLLDRARQGDQAALDRLFARHAALLRRWASGRLPRWAVRVFAKGDSQRDLIVDSGRNARRPTLRCSGRLVGRVGSK